MKILHVVRQFHPSIGGLEEYVFNLASEQIKSGHNVEVLTLDTNFQTDEKLAKQEQYEEITIHRVSWIFSKRYSLTWIKPSFLNRYDVIHIHAVDYFIDYITLLGKLRLVTSPIYLTTHGGFFHTPKQSGLKQLWFKTITRFSLINVKRTFTISTNDHNLFKKITNRCLLVPNGVRLVKFGPKLESENTQFDMVYLGRLSSNKRLDWLIEAYSKLPAPLGSLKIIGNSKTGDADHLKNCIEKNDQNNSIQLLLNLSDSEIQQHLSSAKFVVSASEYEGFGLSVIELMSYGLVPFLSGAPDSFVDFINESKCGELFDYDFQNFQEKYLKLTQDWSVEESERATLYSNRFSWQELSKIITDGYES